MVGYILLAQNVRVKIMELCFNHFPASVCFPVMAINSLYVALEYPPLLGWLLVGGDPCGDKWQGVECVFSNITELYVDSRTFELLSIIEFYSLVDLLTCLGLQKA